LAKVMDLGKVRRHVQWVIEQHATAARRRRVSLDELDAMLDEMAEDSKDLPALPESRSVI